MPRYKLTIEYDGTGYAGWQRQTQEGQHSVQEAVEYAVSKFVDAPTTIQGAGRTDAGVHAMAQVAHVDIDKEHEAFRVMQGINFHLFVPGETATAEERARVNQNRIAVIAAERVDDAFSARFSALRRHYLYRIINRRARLGLEANRAWHVVDPLDIGKMREAAQHLVGHHDFTSFRDTNCQAKSPEKTLEQLDIVQQGSEVHIITSARSFLHHQVRIMTGSLVLVGKGKWSPKDLKNALDAKDRKAGGPTSPPDGLYLTRVDY